MKPILGKPILELMIERVKKSRVLDDIVLATTTNDDDGCLVDLANSLGIKCFRGSEDDVLDRVLKAARENDVDIIVELTGDCPFIDPALIDKAVDLYLSSNVDYLTNSQPATYPIGMGIQVFRRDILEDVARRTDDPDDREHVTLYIYRKADGLYSIKNMSAPDNQTDPYLRLTLDTKEDLVVVARIFEALYPKNTDFDLDDILGYLRENPDIRKINDAVEQRWV